MYTFFFEIKLVIFNITTLVYLFSYYRSTVLCHYTFRKSLLINYCFYEHYFKLSDKYPINRIITHSHTRSYKHEFYSLGSFSKIIKNNSRYLYNNIVVNDATVLYIGFYIGIFKEKYNYND